MKVYIILLGFVLETCSLQLDIVARLNMTGLAKIHGYPIEQHEVLTDDGYYLTVFRIPGKNTSKPILFVHGILCTSVDWIVAGPNSSMAYLAADYGLDVWLINNRGNAYSKRHKTLKVSDSQFWDFSFHELGTYDLPAVIDYILYKTNQKQLFYVGHSQGTTQYFVLTSERPEYAKKIKLSTLLAPVVFLGPTPSLMTILANALVPKSGYNRFIGVREIFPLGGIVQRLSFIVCNRRTPTKYICPLFLNTIFGKSVDEIPVDLHTAILGHYPAGCSTKQLYHYGQVIKNRNQQQFLKYNYNSLTNRKLYGFSEPLKYNLNSSSAPISFFYGKEDLLASPRNVELLLSKLPQSSVAFTTLDEKYNHIDYLYGKNARLRVYLPALNKIIKYI